MMPMTEKVMKTRNDLPFGNLMFMLRDEERFPHTRVAACESGEVPGEWVYVTCTHSPKDKFSKKESVRQAEEKVMRGEFKYVKVPMGANPKQAIIKAIAEDTNVPQRTREAARVWLETQARKNEVIARVEEALELANLAYMLSNGLSAKGI